MPETDLLTRLDALRSYLRHQYEDTDRFVAPDIRAGAQEVISRHLATVDDACERLQFDAKG